MQKMFINRGDSGWFSEQHLRLVYDQQSFGKYITEPFSKDALIQQIERKSKQFGAESRLNLQKALTSQYEGHTMSASLAKNIEALTSASTFTITTGHQLSLFMGPMYLVIKILHVLKMCEEMNAEFPEYNFVPVYWMATEDHDFEEIQSCSIFNNKITWESDQKGPVGLFDLDGLSDVKKQLHERFKNNPDGEVHSLIDSLDGTNYADAMRRLVNELFGDRGLLILDGDDPILKSSFAPILRKELESSFAEPQVNRVTSELLNDGGKDQVMAREINLFYNEKGLRSRIQRGDNGLFAEGKGALELEDLVADPQKVSPNVILRPLYQEFVLPNLAYIGGGGEISYWLQLRGVFDAAEVVYPLIQVRNSVVWFDRGTKGKLDKIGGKLEDVFKDEDAWKKEYVQGNAGDDLDMSGIDTSLESLKNELSSVILGIDPNKEQFLKAELARIEKQVDGMKDKAVKFSKGQHDQAMKAIEFVKSRINPNGGLQERSVNFFQFCNTGDVQPVIEQLYAGLQPFEGDLVFLVEND
ncbi:MAG: bacillithiol biosynthesis cysteine-adding enzyme BshC [Fluviicola sp. XM-24bin1]|nr:MAG: bacillithiol biosynthesis cysteine-adding enzyme BshC [Fluviicola sp. XM-24bin1]